MAGLLPRTPELLVTILGTWRAGAVYQPLFTAFGPKAIEHRVQSSGARTVVTDGANRAKLDEVEGCPAVVTVAGAKGRGPVRGDFSFWAEVERRPADFAPVMRRGDDPFLMMFTSGTTGPAKPLLVPLRPSPPSPATCATLSTCAPRTPSGTWPIPAGPTACTTP